MVFVAGLKRLQPRRLCYLKVTHASSLQV